MVDFQIIPVAEASLTTLMKSIDRVIINPIIIFMFACAMAYFLYGLTRYLLSPGNEEVHKKSKSIMIWGVFGLFIMTAVFGIMKIILSTIGENKIKVNNNGDFVVTGVDVKDRDIADNTGTGLGFGDTTDVKDISTITGTPKLPQATFTTSPFPTYQKDALCWREAYPMKSNTEYDALDQVKKFARSEYLRINNISDKDVSKKAYPVVFGSKVLYDVTTRTYYAWLDVRAPIGQGTMEKNCNTLKVLKEAPVIPQAAVFSSQNISSSGETPDLPLTFYTTSPFATYEPSNLCWVMPVPGEAETEYDALEKARTRAKAEYAKIADTTGVIKANYPILYTTIILYNNKTSKYYVWLDARAPKSTGTVSDCSASKLTVVKGKEAREMPESTLFSKIAATSDEINLSQTVLKNTIKDFTKSPFLQKYEPNALCWRKEDYGKSTTEFGALTEIKTKMRKAFLSDNNLLEEKTAQNLPAQYGMLTAYDKETKNYYVWMDARAPIKGGRTADCTLKPIGSVSGGIPEVSNESGKKDPLKSTYTSDANYYRAIGSGVSTGYSAARNIAIKNALIRIANEAGVETVDDIQSPVILEERYYQKDTWTGNYDYWVALEARK